MNVTQKTLVSGRRFELNKRDHPKQSNRMDRLKGLVNFRYSIDLVNSVAHNGQACAH